MRGGKRLQVSFRLLHDLKEEIRRICRRVVGSDAREHHQRSRAEPARSQRLDQVAQARLRPQSVP